MLTDDGPVLLECNARLGDPEAQVILPRLAVRARAAAAGGRARRLDGVAGRGSPASRLPVAARRGRRDRPGGRGLPGRATRGRPIDGPRRGARPRARSSSTPAPAGDARRRYGTDGGRVLAVVGRGAGPAAARDGGRARRRPDLVGRAAAPPRHRGGRCRPRPVPAGARPMIRRYTLPEMGAIWSDAGALRGHAPGRARRRPRPGRARADPGRGARRASRRARGSTSSGSPRSSGRPTTTSSPSSARSPSRSGRRAATSTSG